MSTDLERLNIILAARDREFAAAMERNQRRVERFARRSQKDLSKTARSFDKLGAVAKRLGPVLVALGGAALVGQLRRTVSALDDIGKTADKMGLTTDALQELRTVAESAGIAQSSLDSSLERFNKRLGEAAMGTGAASKALKQMGLDAGDLATMGLDNALSVVADRIAAIPEPTERAAQAAALFGREGVAMVNLLREGSAGMDQMRAEAQALGIVIDESLIRGAEDAQTKLDLMSRVISAQLSSALVELAPMLVGAATAAADFARGLVSAIEAAQNFLNPQSDLEIATSNLVEALGDEITQSQLLERALGAGVNMSVAVASQKYAEASARYENVRAIIAEYRAAALASDEFTGLTDQIQVSNDALRSLEAPRPDDTTRQRSEQYEAEQSRLVGLIKERQNLLRIDQALEDQRIRAAENMAKLQAGLAGAQGGVVSITGDYVAPIIPTKNKELSGAGRAAATAIPDLSDYADVMDRIASAFGEASAQGADYAQSVEYLDAMLASGVINADQYKDAIAAIKAEFDAAASGAERLEQMAANAAATMVTDFKNAGDVLSNLLGQLAGMAAKSAFEGLFSGGGIFKALAPIFTGDSFEGGGDTRSGPRAGGLDGKGGFLAMMHPDETVIDHKRPGQGGGGGGGGGGVVAININVSGARGNSEVSDMVEAGVRQGLQEYDRLVLPRRIGQVRADPRRIG